MADKIIKIKHDVFLFALFACLISPLFIFFSFWINLYISIPLLFILIYLGYKYYEGLKFNEFVEIEYSSFFVLLILNSYIIYSCGIGGFTEQKYDLHLRSNLVFSHLIFYDWPVIVQNNYSEFDHFSYYIGYFLPVSFISRILGNTYLIPFVEFIWVLFILQISTILFYSKFKLKFKLYLILLPNGFFWILDRYWLEHSYSIRFFSFFTNLAHGPQQVLTSLILILLMEDIKQKKDFTWAIFFCALSFFWSPFVTLGVGLIYVLPNIKRISFFSWVNFYSVIIGLLLLSFYSSKNANYYFSIVPFVSNLTRYCCFWILDILLVPFLFWKSLNKEIRFQIIYISGVLILISLINFGKYNDLMSKTSAPLLLYYYFILIQNIQYKRQILYTCIVLIFSLSSIKLLLNYQFIGTENGKWIEGYKNKTFKDLVNDSEINSQYYSKKNSFYNTYLSKR